MYKTKIAAAVFAAFFTVSSGGRHRGGAGDPDIATVAPSIQLRNDSLGLSPNSRGVQGVVQKTVFSNKVRLVFVVGLEGTGHHYLNTVFLGDVCKSELVHCLGVCPLLDVWYNKLGNFSEPSEYKDGLEQLRREMGDMSLVADGLPGKTVALASWRGHCQLGQMSFPNFGGIDKPLQYVDLKIPAEETERAGIDLRLIYLSREAEAFLISTTEHRGYGSFTHEARVLINAASVVSSSLAELHPDFWTCFAYEKRFSSEQASRVAGFVMPTTDSASFLSRTIVNAAGERPQGDHVETEVVSREEGWELVSDRLQDKLDEIERDHC